MVSKTFERSLNHDFYSGETEDAPMDYYSDYDDDADDYFDEGDASDHADSRRPEVYTFSRFLILFLCVGEKGTIRMAKNANVMRGKKSYRNV
ncbi:unnamed protein product [Vicia faba]|uniref:Uncharacterized protein n=1 Tax=Vicia faba TaxID=3906 RepID=A0AAV0YVF8_VICFA|nr:unnamed protein product [Vicia faba]